jgi:site-specific DNA recombinase
MLLNGPLAVSPVAPVWDTLTPLEQARIVQLLVERVDYDGLTSSVSITFHATDSETVADESVCQHQEQRA